MFYGSIVALVTPFTPNHQLDEEALKDLVKYHVRAKTDGIICFGLAEESLSDEEKTQILKICTESASEKIKIIAGIGEETLEKSIFWAKKAKECHSDACLISIPSNQSLEAVVKHYEKISKIGLPIIAQDLLTNHEKKTALKPSDWEKIAKIENIEAINEVFGNLKWIEELSLRVKIPVLTGIDALSLSALQCGAKGVVSLFANLFPKEWSQMMALAQRKKFSEAFKIYDLYKPLMDITSLEESFLNIQYVLSLKNRAQPPLKELSEFKKQKLEEEMEKLGFLDKK